jgi:hypothetical protein
MDPKISFAEFINEVVQIFKTEDVTEYKDNLPGFPAMMRKQVY